MNFVLEKPNYSHEKEAMKFTRSFLSKGVFDVGGLAKYMGDYEGWLDKVRRDSNKVQFIKGNVQTLSYFICLNDTIVAYATIKPVSEEIVAEEGHIGLFVSPNYRGLGYSNEILLEIIKKCKSLGMTKVLLTCDQNNIASYKSIENNCGKLFDIIKNSKYASVLKRYHIDVDEAIERKQNKTI